jgi:hypothetical protein
VSPFRLPAAACVWSAGLLEPAAGEQAVMEYGSRTVEEMLRWSAHAAQSYWYYVVGGIVLLLLLWGYLRK